MPRWPERTFEQRFLSYVSPRDERGCMEWHGARKGNGYGIVYRDGRFVMPHRVMWSMANGRAVPDGMMVMHACDNRACVNPEHLSLGDNSANVRDMVAKGRRVMRGKPCAKITSEDRASMRQSYMSGGLTMRNIASRFGCSYGAARSAIKGLVQ